MTESLHKKIGSTLKALRTAKGWSLDTTREKTGVSKAMLGQIERGESAPTVATLWKIASGFEVSFSSFIEGGDQVGHISPVFLKYCKTEPLSMASQEMRMKITPLFPLDRELAFEYFVIELSPGCTHLSSAHQKNVVEHIVPVAGVLEVVVDEIWHVVHLQEGLRFIADRPHGYRNSIEHPVIFHNIIDYPNI